MTSEYQKMIAGEPYHPFDPELRTLAQTARQKQADFNQELDPLKGAEIIKSWFGLTGENLYVNPRLVVDYGVNIHLGENFYSNWNLTMLDVCPIRIGNNAMLGPNCQFLTPLHPLDPDERNSGVEYGKPITIGDNFWAGGGVIVLPGVTLGNNVVAGAGAVITKSFGDNVVLGGNPARVIKEIPIKKTKKNSLGCSFYNLYLSLIDFSFLAFWVRVTSHLGMLLLKTIKCILVLSNCF